MRQTKTWLAAALAVCFILWGGVTGAKPACAAEGEPAAAAAPAAMGAALGGATVVPYKTLTWDDFQVREASQSMAADTEIALSFRSRMHVNAVPGSGYSAHVSGITFTGGFDRLHSWRRSDVLGHPDAPRLLLHEQGHLDIAEIGRRRLAALPLSVFPEGHGATMTEAVQDLQTKMAVWFSAEAARIKARQTQYDTETEHSIKQNAQQTWNALLTREIANTVPAPDPLMASR